MPLSSGTRVGPYEVVAPLGAGGMGEVYRARDPHLDRDVAVKVLPVDVAADPIRRARLVGEARAAAALNHPNICTIYEVGEWHSCPYIAMELIDGESLSGRIAEGALATDDVLRYGRQLADALAHAHDRGVIHRDLKAANVMALPDGRVKVLDFGLAKRSVEQLADMTTRQSLTESGAVPGTLVYMAPEQLRGQSADAGSDVWALGVILYEMAAGVRPFRGATAYEISVAILRDAPPTLPRRVPPGLDAIILRCLEKDPNRRYRNATEVRTALDAIGTAGSQAVPRRRRWMASICWRDVAAFGIAATAVVVLFAIRAVRHRSTDGGSAIRSIAVLPLENLSHDPDQDYLAAGVHEGLITELSRIGISKVIAKPTSDTFKGSSKPLAEIGRQLGVDAVITGSVLRANNRVQVSAQLVSPGTGTVLWANRYERGAADILSVQDDLVSAIARELHAKISPGDRARLKASARPVNPAAHDGYLKARSLFASFTNSPETKYLDAAIAAFERAIQIDPNYAPPYAGLSWAYLTMSQGSWRSPKETFPKARAAALKATALDADSAEAHAALGAAYLWFDWNWSGAQQEIQRALTLNPDSVEALTTSEVYSTLVSRHSDEAVRTSQRILELDPLNPFSRVQPAWVALYSERYEDAIANANTLVELSPNNLMGPMFLAESYAAKRNEAEVVRNCARVMEILSGAFVMQFIGECAKNFGMVGRLADAHRLLQRLEHPPEGIWLDPVPMGDAYAGIGDVDHAVEWYQRGLEERSPTMLYLNVHRKLEPVRADPRFEAVFGQMNFP